MDKDKENARRVRTRNIDEDIRMERLQLSQWEKRAAMAKHAASRSEERLEMLLATKEAAK